MASSAERIRSYSGPAILSYGFRPFFLAGGLWAAIAVGLWLPVLAGAITLPTALAPLEWHTHEMIFGYVPAVVAGFLLTAVPNWTGRLPVVGAGLGALFAVWLAGRVAMLVSAWTGYGIAAIIDLAFLAALALVVGREIVASKNTRNLKVLAVVGLLFAGNALFHLEVVTHAGTGFGARLGLAATVLLIMLIGGRVIPSFTHNWLARRGPGRLPATPDKFDLAVLAASAVALLGWVAAPGHVVTGLLALVAGVLNVARLYRWAGERTTGEALVLILHVAYAFVPAGFLLVAFAIAAPGVLAPSGALHAWTAGAVGLMTLAIMTRASLGHTGRRLTASRPVQLIYVAATVAALVRIAAGFGALRDPLLLASAIAWVAAFAGFVVVYAPLLLRPRA